MPSALYVGNAHVSTNSLLDLLSLPDRLFLPFLIAFPELTLLLPRFGMPHQPANGPRTSNSAMTRAATATPNYHKMMPKSDSPENDESGEHEDETMEHENWRKEDEFAGRIARLRESKRASI